MTWRAPEVDRPDGSLVAGEWEMLPDFLGFYRATLLHKCAGLTGEELARRTLPPSSLSLLGLIRHLAKVERIWFRERFAGDGAPRLHPGTDTDFDQVDPARAEQEYAALLAEWQTCDDVVSSASLDDQFTHDGETYALRLVYVHLIGEYARHCGHADLLREQLDGVTGP